MTIVPISTARDTLFSLAKATIESHEPVTLTSKTGNVVLLSEEDFRTIQETLYLQAIPGLVKDVKSGKKIAKKDLATRDKLPW